jgi:flagellar motor switch protein FliN
MSGLEDLDIRETIIASINNVFDTMFSMEVSLGEDLSEIPSDEKRVVGSVNFAGELAGIINIHISDNLSRTLTAKMMGIEEDEIEDDDEIKDLIGEMINIVGGNLKSAFTDVGISCAISTPSLTAGSDFMIASLNMETYERLVFQAETYLFMVEMGALLKSDAEKISEGDEYLEKIDREKLKSLDVRSLVADSVVDIFDTMFSMEVAVSEADSEMGTSEKRMVGSIKIAGDVAGVVSLHISDRFSRTMTAQMLGIEEDEIEDDDEVKDLIGEVINIISGNLKSAYVDAGISCAISPPAITIGSDFTIDSLNIESYERFDFQYQDDIFQVEVGVKPSDKLTGFEIGTSVSDKDSGDATAEDINDSPEVETVSDELNTEEGDAMVPEDSQNRESGGPDKEKVPDLQKDDSSEGVEPGLADPKSMDFLLNLPLDITVEYGRARRKIAQLLEFTKGTVIELSKLKGEPVDILANNKLIAKGEVIVENDKYGIKITEIISRLERIKNL